MFEDVIRRGKQKARAPFCLSPGQSHELQRAASILESVADLGLERGEERLAYALSNMVDRLRQIVRAGDAGRTRYLRENRDPKSNQNQGEAMSEALDENARTKPATHTLYTPVWKPVWDPDEGKFTAGKFKAWLAVGEAWQDDSDGFICKIQMVPINHEETATGYFYCIPVGRPKPERLTITCDKFLEQRFAAYHE